jgi:hypothetical protein
MVMENALAMLTWCNVLFGENGIDAKEKKEKRPT